MDYNMMRRERKKKKGQNKYNVIFRLFSKILLQGNFFFNYCPSTLYMLVT